MEEFACLIPITYQALTILFALLVIITFLRVLLTFTIQFQ